MLGSSFEASLARSLQGSGFAAGASAAPAAIARTRRREERHVNGRSMWVLEEAFDGAKPTSITSDDRYAAVRIRGLIYHRRQRSRKPPPCTGRSPELPLQ